MVSLPAAAALYEEMPVIKGQLPQESVDAVIKSNERAEGAVSRFLRKYGLGWNTPNVPMVADAIEPENGIVNGYTDGNKIGINPYIIPGNSLFYKFSRKLAESNNPMAKYLRQKLSKPIENLTHTIVHEKLHVATQMKERYASDGGRTNFLNVLYKATEEYFSEKLPKPLKPMSKYIAGRMFVPMVEGLNQAATYEALGLKSNRQIKGESIKNPTTYDKVFMPAAIDALDGMGVTPGGFYRNYNFGDAWLWAKEYAKGFCGAIGKYLSAPKPTYATA